MESYRNGMLSLYLTTGCLNRLFADETVLEQELAFFENRLKVGKVYLECFRDVMTDRDLLRRAKTFFDARGYRTATGFMPVARRFSHTGRMMCFTDPEVETLFADMMRDVAALFDEIMIDDSFSTDCTCARCRERKGEQTWQAFRTALMTDFSAQYILKPARDANPHVRVTLKYPTWHESFAWLGYNTETQPHQYDEIYSGTETRHTTYSLFRNPRYTSYSLIRYLDSLPPHNNRGGWFDPYQSAGSIDIYLEQAELTLFANPRELTLFCWNSITGTEHAAALGVRLEKLDRVMHHTGNPQGIATYLPHHSKGEDHVFDFLGMCGVPTEPVVLFPDAPNTVLCTAASACDPALTEKIKAHLTAGGDVCMTSGCLAALQDRGISDCTALRVTARSQAGQEFGAFDVAWSADNSYAQTAHPVSMPVIDWVTNECVFLAMQTRDASPNPVFVYSMYGGGKAYVLNIPDSYADLYDIPAPVYSQVRKHLSKGLSVWMEGETKLALFPRDNQTALLRSYLAYGSAPLLHVRGAATVLRDLYHETSFQPLYAKNGETVFRVPMEGGMLRVLQWN